MRDMSTALSIRDEHADIPPRDVDIPRQDVAHAIAGTMEQLKAVRSFIKAEFEIGYKDDSGKIIPGRDAGLIPGCGDKPTLFLPGAQKATMYFNCFPTYKVREKDLGGGHVEYRVRCLLISRATREQVGEGVGCCSTMEKKYRWRGNAILCPACGKPAIFKSKDKPEFYCWRKKDGCGATFALNNPAIKGQGDGSPVENPDLYDMHNTVLKMAKKRAHVDAAMTLACLSELFTQDIEDTYGADEVRAAARPYEGEVAPPGPPPAPPPPAPEARPAAAPRPENRGHFTKEAAALTGEFLAYLKEECGAIQARWQGAWEKRLDRAMDDGKEVPARIPKLINTYQAKGHLLKWARATGRLHPGVEVGDSRSREAEAYLSGIFHAGHDEQMALINELGAYIRSEARAHTRAIYANHPELAPDGYHEEEAEAGPGPDHGDACEGDDDGGDALDALDRDLGEGGEP